MTKTEKQKLFTQTALAQIDLIDAAEFSTLKDRHRTEWCALHGLVKYLDLSAEYINWQYETFGGALFNISRDVTGYYADKWEAASNWYISARMARINADRSNNVTVNDIQADKEYYMGG